MTQETQIIPALKGQLAIVLSTGKNSTFIDVKPLVAWRVNLDDTGSCTTPIPIGMHSDSAELFVVLGNGIHCFDENGEIQTISDVHDQALCSGNPVVMSDSFERLLAGHHE